jgi:superfamily I DNA/RNA helicase
VDYTGAQHAAIGTIDAPLLIVACAGSGKTQVISARIVEILRRSGVRPRNIVAFTFTDKAAAQCRLIKVRGSASPHIHRLTRPGIVDNGIKVALYGLLALDWRDAGS